MNIEVLISSLPLAPTSVTAAATRSSKQPVLAFIVSPGSGAPRAPSCSDRPWDQHFFHGLRRTKTRSSAAHAPYTPSAACTPTPVSLSPPAAGFAQCFADSLTVTVTCGSFRLRVRHLRLKWSSKPPSLPPSVCRPG